MAKSLMEGMDTGPAPTRKVSRGGDTGKLVLAVLLLVVAGLVFAWSRGWIFAGSTQGPQLSAEEKAQQQKDFTEQQKRTEQQIKTGAAKIGGSS